MTGRLQICFMLMTAGWGDDMADGGFRLSPERHALRKIDLSAHVRDESTYEARKRKLQKQLLAIQQAFLMQRQRAVIVFEGWDAAGKGGAIRRLTEPLDPRAYHVWPIAAPAEDEKGVHFLYRFWRRLPQPGTMAIFDRSWYGRVLVERVEGLAKPADWRRAYREINEFERMLDDDGISLIKFFFHVSPAVQLKRLEERATDPFKRWKITADDFRNRTRWKDYEAAIDDMLDRTWTMRAPWHVVPSDHKWYGRLVVLETVVDILKKQVNLKTPKLDDELLKLLERAKRRGPERP